MTDPPEWFLGRLVHQPVAQAVLAVTFTAGPHTSAKELHARLAAAARGAASGMVAADPRDGISCLDETLIAMQSVMNAEVIPKPEQAKEWLWSHGGHATASALSKLTVCHNTQAHSLGRRVVADAQRLAAQSRQGGEKPSSTAMPAETVGADGVGAGSESGSDGDAVTAVDGAAILGPKLAEDGEQ